MVTAVETTRTVVSVDADGVSLPGVLECPADPKAIVLFAHGAGSSHTSPRNAAVARWLAERGFASLRFDLLTEPEAAVRANVFDTGLLTERLLAATRWIRQQPGVGSLPVAYFGASTGGAAAMAAAARAGTSVAAVVLRGGRPDLAIETLPEVQVPTLLIVGGRDEPVLALNRLALRALGGPKRLTIVPGATHLFEEAGTLKAVGRLAADWFDQWIGGDTHYRGSSAVQPVLGGPPRY